MTAPREKPSGPLTFAVVKGAGGEWFGRFLCRLGLHEKISQGGSILTGGWRCGRPGCSWEILPWPALNIPMPAGVKSPRELEGAFECVRFCGDLQRLDVLPGDQFVLMVPDRISQEQCARLRLQWEKQFLGPGLKPLLILDGGMTLGAVRGDTT